ncbi:MAG TPA: DUF6443 domain-containing protein, partial [Puia sp.]|nr:DUF6443 domain-containing protein [Puia sp.]
MRLCIRQLVWLAILVFFAVPAFSQTGTISGATVVATGETDHYLVSWQGSGGGSVSWSVGNGTILVQSGNNIQVQWSNSPAQGTISASNGSQQAQLTVSIVAPSITLSPSAIAFDNGGTPQQLTATLGPGSLTSFSWQQSTDLGANWLPVQSFGTTYSPPTTVAALYRAVIVANGTSYFSNIVLASFIPADPGTFSLTQQPAYNGTVGIVNTPAHGGSCPLVNYTYIWEQSVDGQPWTAIGTGVNYPAGVTIIGNTDIRRKMTCNGVAIMTNVVHVIPSYTSVDHENLNYIRTVDVHVAGISTWYQADQLPIDSKDQSTTYLDGLGRAIQKVGKSASYSGGAWVDMVQPIVYDQAGRTTQQYLPYPTANNPGKFKSSNLTTDQAAFVRTKFSESSTAPTWSQTVYDNSPLNRVVHSYAPGQNWGGNGVGVGRDYDFNTVDEKVHIWNLDYSSSAIPVTSTTSVYPTGSLFKFTTTDEKGLRVVTYNDLSGNTILKKVQLADPGGLSGQHAGWACTYYVYDDLNHLRFTIPAKVVDYLDNNAWILSQQMVNDLCFVYTYDLKGRTITKKQPGI